MKIIRRILTSLSCIVLLGATVSTKATASPPEAKMSGPVVPASLSEASFAVTYPYTAQRRPRVTVLGFDDTNTDATTARYSSAVEAMLVTFLKRKSQFVVVERQKLGHLLDEKQRLQGGMVQTGPDDKESQALLEKIDVFVLGNVTLLNVPTSVNTQSKEKDKKDEPKEGTDEDGDEDTDQEGSDRAASSDVENDEQWKEEWGEATDQDGMDQSRTQKRDMIQGSRIEIDVKLMSRFDGRIIAAAQRSGPVACLRSIVERLGIALEQEFLRPYYGTLTVTLNDPEHIRVFLTPVLPEDALDEEKPPVERSATVTIGVDHDRVEPWTTDPTTYTIRNLLSGWYSMRVERPGYSPIGGENARWEVRKRLGEEVVYDRVANLSMEEADPAASRFVVRVDPLTTEVVDGNALKFTFVKEGGSLAPLVKRQYLDTDFSKPPQRVVLVGGEEIELNQLEPAEEYADDERCDLFEEEKPLLANYGRTFVAIGEKFDFDLFTGGELIIEDYQGEVLPVGKYRIALWEPSYRTERSKIRVRAGDDKKQIKTSLTRETAALTLTPTGTRPENKVSLKGRETNHEINFTLNFDEPKALYGVPADTYITTTNITDLNGWQSDAVVIASNVTPPIYDIHSEKNKPQLIESPRPEPEPMSFVGIKTHFGLGGRLEALSQRPDPLSADLVIDENFLKILNLLLYRATERPIEERSDLWTMAVDSGRQIATDTVKSIASSGLQGLLTKAGLANTPISLEGILTNAGLPSSSESLQASLTQMALEGLLGKTPLAQIVIPPNAPPKETKPANPGPGRQPAPPAPDAFPNDPETLRKLLAARLEVLDFVVLDSIDMMQLRRDPKAAALLARYVASGGSLFAYVSAVGDYRQVVGVPLIIEAMGKPTRRLDLTPGEVEGLIPRVAKKEFKVKARRALPEVAALSPAWRTVAYSRRNRTPRIVETGGRDGGGYVALWLDDPQSFRSRWGGTRPKVEETRARVEDYVLQKARELMRHRFSRSTSQAQQPCAAPAQ